MKRILCWMLLLMLCLPCALAQEASPKELILGMTTLALPENSAIGSDEVKNGERWITGVLEDGIKPFGIFYKWLSAEEQASLMEKMDTTGEDPLMSIMSESFAGFQVSEFEIEDRQTVNNVPCYVSSVDFKFLDAIDSGMSMAVFSNFQFQTIVIVVDVEGTAKTSAPLLEQIIAPMMIE